ncbi:uncharacterized protein RCC_03052 [Ramularia collo-cygni]|uniref:Uncharacterized protein n=1 Tax=Ramularia collo-cygni TaxID=112498 RepID=A0A2D3V6V1_9PEZI|nr:uncharacterized protein RCC_03052 [Ramularia collo-cygni]CZT17219.1 uncharacterized protein RCC_03052 [Ramularia collo-cygni]
MAHSSPTARCISPRLTDGDSQFSAKPAVRNRTINGAVSSKSSASRLHDQGDQPSLRPSRSNLPQDHQKTARPASKKKAGGLLGFLKLKEPSTSALQDFADHERKRAAQKGGKSMAAGIPNASSQKLPDHVPRVNSKWNGLPEPSKAKQRKTTNQVDAVSVAGPRKSSSSYASSGIARQLDIRPLNAGSGGIPTPPPSIIRSALQNHTNGSPSNKPPTPHLLPLISPLDFPVERRIPEELPVLDSSSCMSASPEGSPRTPVFEEGAFGLPRRSMKTTKFQ